ncbi:MAG TPA: hypothetical protein VJV23_13140 [Candidatus Polarisedimenticolia bacterium]|nr:hypothetical protein [Candidatus Polarisedimenticolia bacterium]
MKPSPTGLAALSMVLAAFALDSHPRANDEVAYDCPPNGNPAEIVNCYDPRTKKSKPGFPKRTEKPFDQGEDVNGDNAKDMRGRNYEDLAGNRIECWCVQKSAEQPSQQFYYAFVPKGGTRQWFGGCFFPNGNNQLAPHCDPADVVKEGPNKGRCKEFKGAWQYNWDYGTDRSKPPNGTKDKHFKYHHSGPNKGKIQKSRTMGAWVKTGQKDANGNDVYIYVTDPAMTEMDPPEDPPSKPKDLLAVGPDSNGGSELASFALIPDLSALPAWTYSLLVAPPFHDGARDPNTQEPLATSVELSIRAGDELTITGTSISAPFVSGNAALPSHGGWQIAGSSHEHVTFRATQDVSQAGLNLPLGDFGFTSSATAGPVRWAYAGEDISAFETTTGPAAGGIPALSAWGMAALLSMVAAGGCLALRRRERAGRHGRTAPPPIPPPPS